MKFFIVLFAIIAAAFAAPQFGGGFGASGSGWLKWKLVLKFEFEFLFSALNLKVYYKVEDY